MRVMQRSQRRSLNFHALIFDGFFLKKKAQKAMGQKSWIDSDANDVSKEESFYF